jgi:hypothetical protein
MECTICGREWPEGSEQAICVELFGECIVCRFAIGKRYREGSKAGTDADLEKITDEWGKRKGNK